jgi:maltose alpha-D-glucosyltransferase/alpha-amylase
MPIDDNPLWYKDAIIYELHVKAFHDKSGDGMGDFRGLIDKLDYLEGLGITAIWLLPFYPSPLKDDGYDIAEYFNINPDYGTLHDFRSFLREAHRRGIRVITELVVNHTSDQHPWFQRARQAKPDSVWRNFYVWSDTPEKYKEARIIFRDYETSNWAWDPVARSYYWHRFYSHQPDLNYDNPQVQKEIFRVMDFWFEMGVDGMRLDAVPYLYEREGTNCENLPETYRFLERLRAHVDSKFKNRMLLAEANQWPEDAAAYFGKGDQCHMNFHFPLMPRMFMGLRMEDRFPIIDILDQTPAIPELCQWAMFLRNHDELTLEMVTDEERDYMYKVYAKDPRAKINMGIRRRLSPLLDNNRRKIELMNFLLFSMPGTPVIYYGDEIGMGDNYYLGDRDGVRTPMQWSPDRNGGFSVANPQKLYLPVIIDPEYHFEAINVETQERNLSSLLWWMKRVIAMRKRFKAFSRGSLEFLSTDNPKVLAFLRRYKDEIILIIINLSRFSQVATIDLSDYEGYLPEEVFSQNRFPEVKQSPYVITLGPYDHHWLLMVQERESISSGLKQVAQLNTESSWRPPLSADQRKLLEREVLPRYLPNCRWFGGKGRSLKRVAIVEEIPLDSDSVAAWLLLLEASYTEGASEIYMLPMSSAHQDRAREIAENFPQSVIAETRSGDEEGILYDAVYDPEFRQNLLSLIARRKKTSGKRGHLIGNTGKRLRAVLSENGSQFDSRVLKAEHSNTAILYSDRLFLKLYRRLDEEVNPDLEVTRFLSEKTDFRQIPLFAGAIEYRRSGTDSATAGLLQSYASNQGDGWSFTHNALDRFFDRVLATGAQVKEISEANFSSFDSDLASVPPGMEDLIEGFYLEMVRVLGCRTGELHLALASAPSEPDFAPEPFSLLYRRSVYQSMRSLIRRVLPLLQSNLRKLPDQIIADARDVLAAEQDLMASQKRIVEKKITATKIRIHGDYHLGQVLFTGKDFVIIDFEGEPSRAASERRLKRSPLRDVAGMIRSFHYAAYSALLQRGNIRAEDVSLLEPWIEPWYRRVSGTFLDSYLMTVGGAGFVPGDESEREVLLETLLLDKAVYELGYELNNRPDWTIIPIRGIKQILNIYNKWRENHVKDESED